MSAADYAVQIKLIIMNSIGIIVMMSLIAFILKKYHHWFKKSLTALSAITLIMILILMIIIKLP